jgi:simple sugar transport system permease protein
MTLSGLFHGMTGFFAVTGTYYTCHLGFYSGMGWNALAAALIAGGQSFGVFPAALLIGYLTTAAERSLLVGGFSADATGIIQAAVFLFISVGSVSVYRRHGKARLFRFNRERKV